MTMHHHIKRNHLSRIGLVLLSTAAFASTAFAGDKPPVMPDPPSSLTTASRISATIEFALPTIASAVERDVPRRLATIDDEIGCVNKRVLVFRVRANCDVDGYVDRGATEIVLKNYQDAVNDITKGISLNSNKIEIAYYDRAIANEALGNIRDAYTDYKKAVELRPDFALATQQLTRFKVVRKHTDGA